MRETVDSYNNDKRPSVNHQGGVTSVMARIGPLAG